MTIEVVEQSDIPKVIDLYKKSFPNKERDSIHKLIAHDGEEGEILTFYEDGKFVGFVYLISYKNISHILYLAISQEFQGKGYGTEALKLIIEKKTPNRILADIEEDDVYCHNLNQRIKRKQFYLHHGFVLSNIRYIYNNVAYQIVVANGMIHREEFDKFWKHFRYVYPLGQYLYHKFRHI